MANMRQAGFSFLEILISLFILSLLLLGIDAMQLSSLRETKSAYYFSVASGQVNVLLERVIAQHGEQLNVVLEEWNKQNAEVLPQGVGRLDGQYPHIVVSIFWGGVGAGDCVQNKIGQSGCLRQSLSGNTNQDLS